MKWTVQSTPDAKKILKRHEQIVDAVLKHRDITTNEEKEVFLHPQDPLEIKPSEVGISSKSLKQAVARIKKAVDDKQPILIYGDYDADGITATAILWETLHKLGGDAVPFIPHRERHGYGLSVAGLEDALRSPQLQEQKKEPLIITVDNGITAYEPAEYIKNQGLELIITDHHQPGKELPEADGIVHTDQIAGSGVAWFLGKELSQEMARNTLDLVAIGTVADLLPLKGANRSIVKVGLEALQQTRRPGLQALYQAAGIDANQDFSTYHIGYIIAPRLNAMGRLEDAMDSLRLLCTASPDRAQRLAHVLDTTNKSRQDLTQNFVNQAKNLVGTAGEHLLIVDHEDFHEGIIGLVAGKLTETCTRPCIVISKGKEISKASARSVSSVNIIELIRQFEHHLVGAGGHPMAAGFTIETGKIEIFKKEIVEHANQTITKDQLEKELLIDAKINISDITQSLFERLEQLKPFGMANSRPVFATKHAQIMDAQTVGKGNAHLKLRLQNELGEKIEAIGFYLGKHYDALRNATHADVAYTITENHWNGRTTLQLQLKDIVH